MRLWSLHPGLLDVRGLVALWREGLLAQKVLLGETRGYRMHPQLARFQACSDPVLAIGCYLGHVADEAGRRNYSFDRNRIVRPGLVPVMSVQEGQVAYEWDHLLRKLAARAPDQYEQRRGEEPALHPLFVQVPGGLEPWERPFSPHG